MSEIRKIATPKMPVGYESLSGLEEVVRDDGSTYYNGIVELGLGDEKYPRKVKLEEDNLAVLWGYDPEDFDDYKADPERWELRRKVAELEANQDKQKAKILDLEWRLEHLEGGSTPSEAEAEAAAPPAEPETQSEHDLGSVDVEAIEDSMARITAILSEMATNPEPEKKAELINELGEEWQNLQAVWEEDGSAESHIDETTATSPITPKMGNEVYLPRSWLSRRWDWLRRRPVREYAPTGNYATPDGRYIRYEDEEIIEVPASVVERSDNRGALLGATALAGVAALAIWELVEHKTMGHSPTREARHNGIFPWGFGHGNIFGHGAESCGSAPAHVVHHGAQHVDLTGIHSHTIKHAHTPNEFQHGVLGVLKKQGIHHYGATAEKIRKMDHWMRGQRIASGMRWVNGHLVQNLTSFPKIGHEFPNAHASAAQGFKIGPGGHGDIPLHKWVRHAESIGIRFSRR